MNTRQWIWAGGLGMAVLLADADVARSQVLEEVVVTGFRRSLENAAEEKRRNTHFTDSIFAEDIGKFGASIPDTVPAGMGFSGIRRARP